jgi:predicted aspartyl protease
MMAGALSLFAGIGLAVVFAVSVARAEEGVIADLPFLEAVPHYGEVDPGHVAIDLSPQASRPFPLLLDTGAPHSILGPQYARAVGVSVRRVKNTPYRRATILGRDLQFLVDVRASDSGTQTGIEIGLLGGNFLEAYVLEVDYASRRVRFLDPDLRPVSEDAADPGEVVVPMRLTNQRPAIEIRLGSGSTWFLVDTGAPDDLLLSEEGARALEIEPDPDALPVRGRNLYGTERASVQRLSGVRVGALDIDALDLRISSRGGSSYRTTNVAGPDQALLGNAFLRRFRVRIDYPHRRVALLPRPDLPAPLREAALPAVAAPPPGDVRGPPESEISDGALSPARPAEAASETVWVDLQTPPEDGGRISGLEWIEVAGWAGVGLEAAYDIVIVVDRSGSTAYASGTDVDGDGRVGRRRRNVESWRSFNPRRLSSDLDDTVLAAELTAAKRLVALLDPQRARIGIVSFADRGEVRAPLGSDRASIESALDDIDRMFGSGATDLAHATRLGARALLVASDSAPETRRKVLLILSDGYPTAPGSESMAAAEALEAAREAGDAGIGVYTFGLGLGKVRVGDVFVEMAEVTGGSHVRLHEPGDILHELPHIDLARVAHIAIENATVGEEARAIRVFPDGSFDGYLRLQPGDNRIRVTARSRDGEERAVERVVHFEAWEPATEDEVLRFTREREELLTLLRERTLAMQLVLEAREKRAEARKQLELELE